MNHNHGKLISFVISTMLTSVFLADPLPGTSPETPSLNITPLAKEDLPKLIELGKKVGSPLDLRMDIARALGLSENQATKARRVPCDFGSGVIIGFIWWEGNDADYIFSLEVGQSLFFYRTDRNLNILASTQTSNDAPVSLPPTKVDNVGFDLILKGWAKHLRKRESK